MAEETLTEALANLNDENIDKAPIPKHTQPVSYTHLTLPTIYSV